MSPVTPPDPAGFRTSHVRSLLIASAAGLALIAAAGATGLQELAPWTASAHAQTPANFGVPGFADLISTVGPAVVAVEVQTQPQTTSLSGPQFFQFGPRGGNGPEARGGMAEGAGFFISGDGYVVTANHVVDDAKSVRITTSDGKTYPARVVGTDATTDVAVLKVDGAPNFTYVKFADQMPRVGDWVVAMGTPYGLASTATVGIVSALGRDIGSGGAADYLQIDAAINEGNSGGPTFDIHGNVVGINDAIFSPSGGSVGIGFDVPADVAKSVVADLVKFGHANHAWLGVQVQDLTDELAAGLGLPDGSVGALVADPQAGSPAAGAGVTAGDVITGVNGTPVKGARALALAISRMAPGATAKLDMLRHGQSQTLNVTLGEQPKA